MAGSLWVRKQFSHAGRTRHVVEIHNAGNENHPRSRSGESLGPRLTGLCDASACPWQGYDTRHSHLIQFPSFFFLPLTTNYSIITDTRRPALLSGLAPTCTRRHIRLQSQTFQASQEKISCSNDCSLGSLGWRWGRDATSYRRLLGFS